MKYIISKLGTDTKVYLTKDGFWKPNIKHAEKFNKINAKQLIRKYKNEFAKMEEA